MQTSYFPESFSKGWNENDIQIHIKYDFLSGMSPSLLTNLFSEIFAMGQVATVWTYGCLVRQGAVEILIRNNVHASEFYVYTSCMSYYAPWTAIVNHDLVLCSSSLKISLKYNLILMISYFKLETLKSLWNKNLFLGVWNCFYTPNPLKTTGAHNVSICKWISAPNHYWKSSGVTYSLNIL